MPLKRLNILKLNCQTKFTNHHHHSLEPTIRRPLLRIGSSKWLPLISLKTQTHSSDTTWCRSVLSVRLCSRISSGPRVPHDLSTYFMVIYCQFFRLSGLPVFQFCNLTRCHRFWSLIHIIIVLSVLVMPNINLSILPAPLEVLILF